MAWLGGTLGEGLSSLKGQINKITKEVLSDSHDTLSDDDETLSVQERLKELEAHCAAQNLEITALREENQNLIKQHQSEINYIRNEKTQASHQGKNEKNFEFSEDQLQYICKLENELAVVTEERNNQAKALDELDLEHEREMDQLITVKEKLKSDVDRLQQENKILKINLEESSKSEADVINKGMEELTLQYQFSEQDNKKKDEEIKTLQAEVQNLQLKIEGLQKEKEESFQKINYEILEHENIKSKLEKIVVEMKNLNDEKIKGENELKKLKSENDYINGELNRSKHEFGAILNEKENDVRRLKCDIERLEAEKLGETSLNIELCQMKTVNDEMRKNIDNLKREHENVYSEMLKTKEIVESLEKENQEKGLEIGQLKSTIEDFKVSALSNSQLTTELNRYKLLNESLAGKLNQLSLLFSNFSSESGALLVEDPLEIISTLEKKLTVYLNEEAHLKKTAETTIEKLTGSCQELKRENEEMNSRLKLENESWAVKELQYIDNLSVLKDNVNKKENEIKELSYKLENNQQNVCVVQSQTDDVKRLEQEINKLNSMISLKENEISNIVKARIGTEKELNIVKSVAEKTEQQLSNILKEKSRLEKELLAWKNTIQNKEQQFLEVTEQKQLLETKCDNYEKQLTEAQKLENELKLKFSEVAESNKKLSIEMEEIYLKADKVENLQKQLDKALMTNSQIEKKCSDLQMFRKYEAEEIENLKALIMVKDSKISELMETCQKLRVDVKVTEETGSKVNELIAEAQKWKDLSVDLEIQRQELLEGKCELEQVCSQLRENLQVSQAAKSDFEKFVVEYRILQEAYEKISYEFEQLNQYKNHLETFVSKSRLAPEVLNTGSGDFSTSSENQSAEEKSLSNGESSLQENILHQHRRTRSDVDIDTSRTTELLEEIQHLKEQIILLQKGKNEKSLLEEVQKLNNCIQQEQGKNRLLQNQCQELKDKESNSRKEVERLRLHLVEVEEHYTTEAIKNEETISELRQQLNYKEECLKNSSAVHTSASIRANQHVELLKSEAKLIAVQRDDLQAKLSAAEDEVQKHVAALTNLEIVLEQFQQDKDHEIHKIITKYEYQLQIAEKRKKELENEIMNLNKQLCEAKDGLNAASRLGEQLEKKSRMITKLEETISELEKKLKETENNLALINQSNICKIDKSLVKNLIVGYVSSQKAEHRTQVLKIMASVLDFNQEERLKTGIDSANPGWLSKVLHPTSDSHNTQSLSEAFIKFLENESRPQPEIKLLPHTSSSSASTSVRKSPILLNDLVLPTFDEKEQSEGSILKNVLSNS